MPVTALSILQDTELCTLIMTDGTEREGQWSALNQCFYFTDGDHGRCSPDEIAEWLPGAKF